MAEPKEGNFQDILKHLGIKIEDDVPEGATEFSWDKFDIVFTKDGISTKPKVVENAEEPPADPLALAPAPAPEVPAPTSEPEVPTPEENPDVAELKATVAKMQKEHEELILAIKEAGKKPAPTTQEKKPAEFADKPEEEDEKEYELGTNTVGWVMQERKKRGLATVLD